MASYRDEVLYSPQRSRSPENGGRMYSPQRSRSPEIGHRIIVEDVIEPFGLPTSGSYANGYSQGHLGSQGHDTEAPNHGYDQTDAKVPYNSENTSNSDVKEIIQRYSGGLDKPKTDKFDINGAYQTSANSTHHIGTLEKVDPYSEPLGEKENAPYRGPLVRIAIDSPDLERGSGYPYPGKVRKTDPLSAERIDELSNRYRERMARAKHRETKQHSRSRSDNCINREQSEAKHGIGSVVEHRELCDNLIIKKYENALLQIDKLETNIKHLKLEVNTLQAAKSQAELRVSLGLSELGREKCIWDF